jgi:hypothetical protein
MLVVESEPVKAPLVRAHWRTAKIRRAYFVQGKSIKAIVRELRVSRRTVRKVIRSEETDFSYERSSQPQPKIGPWRDQLDSLLAANAARASRERLTLIRIFEGDGRARHQSEGQSERAGWAMTAAMTRSAGTRRLGGAGSRQLPVLERRVRHRRSDRWRDNGSLLSAPGLRASTGTSCQGS